MYGFAVQTFIWKLPVNLFRFWLDQKMDLYTFPPLAFSCISYPITCELKCYKKWTFIQKIDWKIEDEDTS